MEDCYIGLGSNLEDPPEQLRLALMFIDRLPDTQRLKTSSFYQTKPVGFTHQPDFTNAVTKIQTALEPLVLLMYLQCIEQQLGRKRLFRGEPRIIDLDLLLYGNQTINESGLIVPHPRMWQREFVLTPLREIAPEIHFPSDAKSGE
jgi:2-amino-4-hydroxy-6-hydroxymethyldihydropteridine diphosphokinase